MNPSIEPHEIGYLAVGLVAFGLTGAIFLSYALDLISRYRSGSNGVLRLLAWLMVVMIGLAVQVNFYMVVVGVSAFFTEPRPFTPNRIFAIVLLYLLAFVSVGASLFTVYVRRKVSEDYDTAASGKDDVGPS